MGVDCNCFLPSNVRIDDVAKVMCILMGKKPFKEHSSIHPKDDTWWAQVPKDSYSFKHTSSPYYVEILIKVAGDALTARGDAGDVVSASYFYECEDKRAGKFIQIHVRSTAFWIAVCKGLVDFFGGEVGFPDYTDKIHYKKKPKSIKQNHPSRNPDWGVFQERMMAIKPLTLDDFKKAYNHAAYKVPELA